MRARRNTGCGYWTPFGALAERHVDWSRHPGIGAEEWYRREALKKRRIPAVVRERVWRNSRGLCAYCGRCMHRDMPGNRRLRFTVDHRMPLAKGGTHDPANLTAACGECNSRKGARLL